VGLLAVKLVIGLVVGASSQLGLLSTGTILGPGTPWKAGLYDSEVVSPQGRYFQTGGLAYNNYMITV